MEYLLIPCAVAQMSDGWGNATLSKALHTSAIYPINECPKAQSQNWLSYLDSCTDSFAKYVFFLFSG